MAKIVILSGIPGSGKSTYAKHVASRYRGTVVSADDYFVRSDGVYRFNPKGLSDAHGECFKKYLDALSTMTKNSGCVIVDNTNLTEWQISPYVLAAQAHGFGLPDPYASGDMNAHEVTIVRVNCEPDVALKRQIHGVPEKNLLAMLDDYNACKVLPWWSVYEVPGDRSEPNRRWVQQRVITALGEDAFKRMRWCSDGNWGVEVHGMYVGIEPDGYIHS